MICVQRKDYTHTHAHTYIWYNTENFMDIHKKSEWYLEKEWD